MQTHHVRAGHIDDTVRTQLRVDEHFDRSLVLRLGSWLAVDLDVLFEETLAEFLHGGRRLATVPLACRVTSKPHI